jgi:hypothetical protein
MQGHAQPRREQAPFVQARQVLLDRFPGFAIAFTKPVLQAV